MLPLSRPTASFRASRQAVLTREMVAIRWEARFILNRKRGPAPSGYPALRAMTSLAAWAMAAGVSPKYSSSSCQVPLVP